MTIGIILQFTLSAHAKDILVLRKMRIGLKNNSHKESTLRILQTM